MPKAAILIDGGYFLKRFPFVCPNVEASDPEAVANSLGTLVRSHLNQLNEIYRVPNPSQLLYRSFYYDARPYSRREHKPVSKQMIDYAKSDEAGFRKKLFEALRRRPNFAVRLGEVRKDISRSWILKAGAQKSLLNGGINAADLADSDFSPALRQKGVDMRIGLDIASIALKRQADIIVLVSGDADFVPAAKLARREGLQFILDPLWKNIPPDLSEHIDRLRSGFPKPRAGAGAAASEG